MGSREDFSGGCATTRNCCCKVLFWKFHVFLCEMWTALMSTLCVEITWFLFLKPVLNWVNVCSPNILQTVRRTMIRFLIELLVHWTWFGQSKLYFVLKWLVMRCKLRPKLAAGAQQMRSRQHDRKCRLKSSQVSILSSSLTGTLTNFN